MLVPLAQSSPYGKYLKSIGYGSNLYRAGSGPEWVNASDAYDALIASINAVYEDVIYGNGMINANKHPTEHHLFDNPFRVVDGPCYAFLIHGKGPAIGGQGEIFNANDATVTSSNIVIENNVIENMKCWNNEVPALIGPCGNHGCIANDPRGSVFQTVKTFDAANPHFALGADGNYNGNVVSDMQVLVAKAILDGTLDSIPSRQTKPNSIDENIITWAEGGGSLNAQWVCNGDSMHHVVKGIILIRVEDTMGFDIENNVIRNVTNLSVGPFSPCSDYHAGTSSENTNEYQAGNIRAVSVAAVRGHGDGTNSQIANNVIEGAESAVADVIIGIDVQGDSSGVSVSGNSVDLSPSVSADDGSDQYIAARIRESVGGLVHFDEDNDFDEEAQALNNRLGRPNLATAHAHISGNIEWKFGSHPGGCPAV